MVYIFTLERNAHFIRKIGGKIMLFWLCLIVLIVGIGLVAVGKMEWFDAFNLTANWYDNQCIAIDQGPIICMIENYRTGMLWNLFMAIPEIQQGMKKLGFESPALN